MNGDYRLNVRPSARRDLSRFTGNILRQLADAIQELAAQPRGTNTKKLQGAKNKYRKRSGNYRILYEIDDAARQVNVDRVVDRKDAY